MASKKKPFAKKKFSAPDHIEQTYAVSLRKIARVVGTIVDSHFESLTNFDIAGMNDALRKYSEIITPYATRKAAEFVASVNRTNEKSWMETSKLIGNELKKVANESEVGRTAKKLIDEQVALIKSLPIDAGRRAQSLALEAVTGGRRPEETAQMIMDTEGVTKSRATLIARTETARANAALTQVRANSVGVTHYIWQTVGDADVRESHAEVDGQIFAFDDPPTLSDGDTGNPGDFPNCRCFAFPLLTDDTTK